MESTAPPRPGLHPTWWLEESLACLRIGAAQLLTPSARTELNALLNGDPRPRSRAGGLS